METAFEKRHQDLIVGKVTTVDRMIFNGHLTAFFPPGSFQRFLTCQGSGCATSVATSRTPPRG